MVYKGATMSFDSLTFARRLKTAGFSEVQAETLADASREMIVHEQATTADLVAFKTELKHDIAALKTELKRDIAELRTEFKHDIAELKADSTSIRAELVATEQRLLTIIEHQTLRLTVRIGIMMAASFSLMTAVIGVLLRFH